MVALGELGERSGPRRVLVVRAAEHASDSATVWRLMAAGASDVLTWDPGYTARHVAARMERWDLVEQHLRSPAVHDRLVGDSPLWRAFLAQVVEIAVFTDAPVLLLGESGTGKELVARLIHDLDPRPAKNDFVILDCSTVVPELSGSEFFGQERGAYTGAAGPRDGAFGLANGGTLFLDEIGELSPAMQAQLLRVVQEHAYKRVGGNLWMRSDFRLVCATNRDLSAAVADGPPEERRGSRDHGRASAQHRGCVGRPGGAGRDPGDDLHRRDHRPSWRFHREPRGPDRFADVPQQEPR